MLKSLRRCHLAVVLASLMIAAFPSVTLANHSWNGYHWARTTNPVTIRLGNNLTGTWGSYLQTAASDWNASSVLQTPVVAGQAKSRNCRPDTGHVEVCNSTYGNNGWLGIAQIWVSGKHITKGSTKMNDTYMSVPPYNTAPWHRLVMCQEVGHIFGLDHQDEDFDNGNLGTCMDYTDDPDGPPSNEHPNQHDYDELEEIYAHLDAPAAAQPAESAHAAPPPAMNDIELTGPEQWGRLVKQSRDGHTAVFEADFGAGHKVFTFVIWADGEGRSGRGR
jgi:hypothetical protein